MVQHSLVSKNYYCFLSAKIKADTSLHASQNYLWFLHAIILMLSIMCIHQQSYAMVVPNKTPDYFYSDRNYQSYIKHAYHHGAVKQHRPHLVYLDQVDSSIMEDIQYANNNNYLGRPIAGYVNNRCQLQPAAAHALARVQQQLKKYSLSLKVYDCYRSESAVLQNMAWFINPYYQSMRDFYYPNVAKTDLVKKKFIAYKSHHLAGTAVDVGLVYLPNQDSEKAIDVDMGTYFGYLDDNSRTKADNKDLPSFALHNRRVLRNMMIAAGFNASPEDAWWHFTFNE